MTGAYYEMKLYDDEFVKRGKNSFSYLRGPNECNHLYGCFTTATYLVTWLLSLLSPLLVLSFALNRRYCEAIVTAATIVLAYAPIWPKLPWLRSFYGCGNISYFYNSSLRFEEDISEKNKVLLCVHPHGIFCLGWGILFGRKELERYTFCFASALYSSPFFRLLTRTVGSPAPADK